MACRIVNLDRVKFNDAVANGVYPCAPATRSGSARVFTEEELLPLFFFARLTEFGVLAGKAGRLACEMASVARRDYAEPAERIIYVQCTSDGFFKTNKIKLTTSGLVEQDYDPEHEQPGRNPKYPNGMAFIGSGRVLFTIDFYIKHVREIIADRLADEASILGEEDPE